MSQSCQQCQMVIKGRSDKKFCSANCKNTFYYAQKKETLEVAEEIDGYLHRNRTILKQIMGAAQKETFDRLVLVRNGFHFDYLIERKTPIPLGSGMKANALRWESGSKKEARFGLKESRVP
jgi:hypothetical protein